MRSYAQILLIALSLFCLSATTVAQQTGGTVWSNQLTFTKQGSEIDASGTENFTVEKVEYWKAGTNGQPGEWKSVSFASSDIPAKQQEIDLGGDYLKNTVFRVLCKYPGKKPTVTISQP